MKEVNGGYISRTFYKIKSPKTNQTESRVEKVINTKGDNYIPDGKVVIICFI